jgi:site-specific DNA-methyltransferase (adenine-specific)
MSIDDIYNLPVQSISEDDTVLFLWVTNPLLKEGLECMIRWGFTYKTVAFSWYKKNKKADTPFFGLGYWTRANVELCLLGTIGKPKRIYKGVSQVIQNLDFVGVNTEQVYLPLQIHSKKPDVVREKIVNLCGELPRIELFARERVDGWDAWGNEIECSIDL